MSKMRVYEYAKEKKLSSKDVIKMLEDMGETVSSHMAVIEEESIKKLNQKMTERTGHSSPRGTNESRGGQNDSKRPHSTSSRPQHQQRPNNTRSGQHQQGHSRPVSGQGNPRHQQTDRDKTPIHNKGQKQVVEKKTTTTSSPIQPQQNRKANPKNKTTNEHVRGRSDQEDGRGGKRFNQGNNERRGNGKRKRGGRSNQPQQKQQKPLPQKITINGPLLVSGLAEKLGRESSEIIKKLFLLGIMATKNQEIDKDTIELIATDYGVEVEEEVFVDKTSLDEYKMDVNEKTAVVRPPVVTIMGHVDHGKTTLLDSIRNTKVTEGEAGGITQHIGAYQVTHNGKKITFLDTPGHAAFTTMRARGAQITDITVLVVAADDGVMPQTVEAINHAKAAGVPIIVAVNKMDKEGANPDRVMQELTEHGLIPEDWGGDTIFVKLSAINGEGIDDLLEMITLVSEVEEYKANPDQLATGSVVEAELDKGRGPVATLLVQNGTLKVGDPIVVGNSFGRIRAMVNDLGRRVKTAGPSTPVEITGLNEVPNAGDQFVVFEDEKTARSVGEARAEKQIVADRNANTKVSLDDLFDKIKEGNIKDLNVIVKADVQGSVEALAGSLQKIDVEGARVNIIHTGAGGITESDVILASASNAIIIGFNVRPDVNAKRTAEAEKVDIRLYRVIYDAINEMEAAMKGMLDPEFREKVIGQVEVRTIFKVSKVGTIAGCYVTEGKVSRDAGIRLIRDGIVIYEGKVDTLKRFKDDAREVAAGYECGITLENFNDVKEGDIMEAYVMEEIKR
ncbi:translation initiation factor IF-2 [Pullulanibacillus sp. KACC 23026]|uniref:translation initiation factor IF-2 n=1 Tax=Pullulanibacillus sp. KACC 23026 TaxID=3028315 RepID=UPI0023B005FC|nr:translation initiation factor IF-2 [Pullulanibacillus sp. KACC 23026]WEG11581.1 translation initiation factor IF-2 [Pullulanibacillus sp. KACC 23026]